MDFPDPGHPVTPTIRRTLGFVTVRSCRARSNANDPVRALSPGCHATLDRMSSIYDLEMTSITGEQVGFDQFRDQVLLIVNVASA